MLLAACAGVQPVAKCPSLAAPPARAVDALNSVGRADPASATWVIALSKHYDKLDQCNAKRRLFER